MSIRTLDPEATRNAILDAAEELFAASGFAAVSISDIARRAVVTKSLIHHHFGSKVDLWRAAKARGLDEFFAAQTRLLETREPDATLLRDSIEMYFRFLQQRPRVVRLMQWVRIEGDEGATEAGCDVIRLGARWIEVAQRRGLVRPDVSPSYVIASFIAAVEGWFQIRAGFSSVLHDDPDTSDEAFLATWLALFLRGVAADATADTPPVQD
jgi:TetR/AcrR family transcriptional regulator